MDILAFVLSSLGTVCICIPSLLKGKNMRAILALVFSANLLIAISYSLTGAFNGAASCYVGAAQTIINYFFERKNKPLPVWMIIVYALAFVGVNLLAFTNISGILAILASLSFVVKISQKSGKQYRIWALVNAGLWAAYDLCNLSFGPLCTHIIMLAVAIFGIVMHDRKKEKSAT